MRKTPIILLASALPLAVQAANTEFSYGGYIKFDAMYSQYNDGELSAGSSGRDFYIPSVTPVGGDDSSSLDFTARSSRFNFKTVTNLENGEKITGFAELDFLLHSDGNEVASNSYSPRLRHFFFTYNNLTFGQTWTTFLNTSSLPETVDFFGVPEGTPFARQPLIRYTAGNFQVSLENPESTVNTTSGTNDDSSIPDVVARYNISSGSLNMSVAAIARQISRQDDTTDFDESETGFGVNVAGAVKIGNDDLKFSVTNGQVARYVGLGIAAPDAIISGGDLKTTDVTAAFVAYRHFWTPQMRSTIAYSMMQMDYGVDNTGLTDSTNSARVNLMYSPVKEITYGLEYSHVQRELDDSANTDGSMDRLQFTAKYSF